MSRTTQLDRGQIDRGTVVANGAVLYREVRGDGPPLLLITGASGDADWYATAADLLAEEFTVVTYDRRGNSRSPAPKDWTATSIDEQADDAAALLRTLGLAHATVLGSSGGGVILTNMILRHPDVVRSAIVHEPPFASVASDPERVSAELMELIGSKMGKGGPRAAMEAFIRLAAGDLVFEQVDPALRERALGNAPLFFERELGAFVSYLPDPTGLAATSVPVNVAAGVDTKNHPQNRYLFEASEWTARAIGVPLTEISGGHVPYYDRPQVFVEELRPMLLDTQAR